MTQSSRSALDMLATMVFPRSASRPWQLRFDTASFESNFTKAAFIHERRSFFNAIALLTAIFTAWFIYATVGECYLGVANTNTMLPYMFGIILGLFIVILNAFILVFFFGVGGLKSTSAINSRLLLAAFSLVAILTSTAGFVMPSVLFAVSVRNETQQTVVSPVGVMAIHSVTIFLTYTLMTIPISVALTISLVLTGILEVFLITSWKTGLKAELIISRFFVYFVMHLISCFVRVVYESRLRTGFWYGGQSLVAIQRLDVEKRLRQKLVLSIMPKAFAEFVFSPIMPKISRHKQKQQEQEPALKTSEEHKTDAIAKHNTLREQIVTAYRPQTPTGYWLPESDKSDLELLHDFHVEKFENVSIIFANICGFTTISSKKRPQEWVKLLNEIFDRFDSVCLASGCEKISILGDRYICLSGCPKPREDHAHCCIEAGFGMCKVVEEFNANHNEELSIHVGIHTGTVQAGLFGTKRYRFDIWGDDCNFCDDVMESSNQPGRILISADTHRFVKDDYIFEAHREIYDFRKSNEMEERFDPVAKRMVWSNKKTTWTYFIDGRQKKCRFGGATSDEGDGNNRTEEVAEPLLLKRGDEIEQAFTETAPISFTEPPVQPFTLCFTNCQVESEYNSRFSYEPLPLDDNWSALGAKNSEFSTDLNFNSLVASGDSEDSTTAGSALDHGCQLLAPVFPNWILYGDNITAFVAVTVIIVASVIVGPTTTTFVAISSVCVIVIGLLLLIQPALPSLIDQQRNNANVTKCFRAVQILTSCFFAAFPAIIAVMIFSGQDDLIYLTILVGSIFNFALFAQVPYYVRTALATLTTVAVLLMLRPTSLTIFFEVMLGLAGMVGAVCLVARRTELAARLAVYAALETRLIECAVKKAQKRNDNLLAFVVPMHALNRFSEQGNIYYQHHPNCGVIVVRIANFADYYEESFSGRDGSLHVLNQIFTEFEGLLEKRRFKDVEKVKTSVPCLLCTAGLDAHRRTMQREKNAHLNALMAFCFELIEIMRKFNEPRQFKFKLRIGFDTGDLVSGIFGSTLLQYDVWGDTVNFANRMCLGDTGQEDGVIQVSEGAVGLLKDKFDFEELEKIAPSGKGDVKTYLAIGEKPIVYQNLVPPPGSASGVVESS